MKVKIGKKKSSPKIWCTPFIISIDLFWGCAGVCLFNCDVLVTISYMKKT